METIEVQEQIADFDKYPSIENSYRPEFIDKIRAHGLENERYLITEKVHGSNTQISYDGKTVKFGTRNHELEENENCYNLKKVLMEQHIDNTIKEIYEDICQKYGNVSKVIMFGEICGGYYPHKDVAKDNHSSKVQKGVYYHASNKWLCFDIAYITKDGEKKFLPGADFLDTLSVYDNVDIVPVLDIVANLTEALAYANDGQSKVATSIFELPELEEDNTMEGVVIRGFDRDHWMGQTRAIIKNKNDKFAEKSHEKRRNVQQEELPEHLKQAIEKACEYITENRINNVISHLGEVQLEDMGKVIGEANRDVIGDFHKETGILNTLEKAEAKRVTKAINTQVAQLVRKIMYERLTTK